jgi:hypothetical protein
LWGKWVNGEMYLENITCPRAVRNELRKHKERQTCEERNDLQEALKLNRMKVAFNLELNLKEAVEKLLFLDCLPS